MPKSEVKKKRLHLEAVRAPAVVDEEEQGEQDEEMEDVNEDLQEEDQDEDEDEEEDDQPIASSSKLTTTTPTSSTNKKKSTTTKLDKKPKSKKPTPGIVYISRIPPGMTPQKVKHLMERWGEVGKIYAQKKDAPIPNPSQPAPKKRHEKASYSEAWVQFKSKSVAKVVAQMLNAEVIGGKKGDRWRDDIWTMKYLSGFKWEMLGEQVAYERQAHTSRLRSELSKSRTEQSEYLRNVELARVLEKRKAKKEAAAGGADGSAGSGAVAVAAAKPRPKENDKASRGYKQRKTGGAGGAGREGGERKISGGGGGDGGMSGVLDNLF